MQVTGTGFTIAEYCGQMQGGTIVINRDYQRSEEVWPPAARSYLIDTILHGYPIPKISLFQKTDLRSRRTIKEIVDGQQRSNAILDFYTDALRLTGKTEFSGKTYSQLEEPDKQRFLDYYITADLFVGATEEDIRQVFRRINSYTVPLNPQEERHATHQGRFKWFIVELTERYASTLKRLGVFNERQLSRMSDAALFTELVIAMKDGIQTAARTKLDKVYKTNEEQFPDEAGVSARIDRAIDQIVRFEPLHNGGLMKPYNFYTLVLAITNFQDPLEPLCVVYRPTTVGIADTGIALSNLSLLANALEGADVDGGEEPVAREEHEAEEAEPAPFAAFIAACSEATNTKKQREERFRWMSRALEPRVLHG